MANAMGSLPTTATADTGPLHTVRETPRSVELPTAQSPFGPMRKREQPPVKIPGPRKPSDIGPRPVAPKQQLTARPLAHDLDPYKVTEPAKTAAAPAPYTPAPRPGPLLARDLYDSHHADLAFGSAA